MPLTKKGKKIQRSMKKTYGAKKGKEVFYASRNKGTIEGVDPKSRGKVVKKKATKKPCPGSKIRSKGKGRGLGIGKGKGPIGRKK